MKIYIKGIMAVIRISSEWLYILKSQIKAQERLTDGTKI
jgi:hypothetical protein